MNAGLEGSVIVDEIRRSGKVGYGFDFAAETYTDMLTAGMMDVMVGALRGVGYSLMPMIVSLIGVCGIRIMWIFTVFRMEQFHTIQNLYISYPLSWFATFLVHLGCFLVIRTKLEKRMKTHGPGM